MKRIPLHTNFNSFIRKQSFVPTLYTELYIKSLDNLVLHLKSEKAEKIAYYIAFKHFITHISFGYVLNYPAQPFDCNDKKRT